MCLRRINLRMVGIVLLLTMLMASFTTSAQTDACGQLSADECARVEDSLARANTLEAAAFTSEVVLTIREIYSRQYFTLRFFLDGAYRINDLFNAPDLSTALTGIEADVSVIVDFSELQSYLQDFFDMPQTEYSFDLSLVDGIGYINLSKLMDPAELETDWYGMDLGSIIDLLLLAGGGMPQDSLNFETSNELQHLPFGLQATGLQRMSDLTVDDVEMERYLWIVDFGELIEDIPDRMAFNRSMTDVLDQLGSQQGYRYTPDEMEAIIDNYAMAVDALSLRVERLIDPESGDIQRTVYQFAYQPSERLIDQLYSNFDPLGLSLLYGDFYFDVTIERSQLDGDFEIDAPDDSTVVPWFDLMPLLDGANL